MSDYPIPANICAVITTYRTDDKFYERVSRIREQVGFVVIIDDGECNENVSKLKKWFEGLKNVYLHHNIRNVGIAASLNKGISIAKQNGYMWTLTLDDDSLVNTNMVERLINGLKNITADKPIGIIGMSWVEQGHLIKSETRNVNLKYFKKRGIITSGSLFSVATYDKVGPFRDEFFIDSVDYDYCLRARAKGLLIIKLEEIGFEHSLGYSAVHNILGLKMIVQNHNAMRVYYASRNSTVLALEHLKDDPLFFVAVIIGYVKNIIKILLYESDKQKKLIEVIRGIEDGITRNLGKRISF